MTTVASARNLRVVVNKTNSSTIALNSTASDTAVIASKANNPPANILVKKAQEIVLQSITNINSDLKLICIDIK